MILRTEFSMEILIRKFRALPRQTRRKVYEYVSLIIAAVASILWMIHLALDPPNPYYYAFIFVEFFVFEIFLVFFLYFHGMNWKERVERLSRDILQAVIFRIKTPIPAIANRFKLSGDAVKEILSRLVRSGKIKGEIKNDVFVLAERKSPTCQLCGKEIDIIDRLMLCPFCRVPSHKDHLIEYVNDVAERCPACKNRLTIADLFA